MLHQGVPGRDYHHGQRDHPAEGAGGRRLLRPDSEADPARGAEAIVAPDDPGGVAAISRGPERSDGPPDPAARTPFRPTPEGSQRAGTPPGCDPNGERRRVTGGGAAGHSPDAVRASSSPG